MVGGLRCFNGPRRTAKCEAQSSTFKKVNNFWSSFRHQIIVMDGTLEDTLLILNSSISGKEYNSTLNTLNVVFKHVAEAQ